MKTEVNFFAGIGIFFAAVEATRMPMIVTDPSQPRKNDSGIETRPGLLSGNQEKSTSWISDVLFPVSSFTGAPDTTGEKMISRMQIARPP